VEWRKKFEEKHIFYEHRLIDDMVAFTLKSNGMSSAMFIFLRFLSIYLFISLFIYVFPFLLLMEILLFSVNC
jgi:hypothetical protein